jgi:tetratricopeptide (TPR) repeat protein
MDNLTDGAGMMPPLETRRRHALAWLESNLTLSDVEGPELSHLAPLLNVVLPLDLPDTELTAQMSGQVRADNTHKLLLRLLQVTASQAPTLLVLEDAHWLDSASWALARLVGQDVRSILLVIATRPLSEPVPLEYRQLLYAPGVQRITLDTLALEDALTLVCRRLGVATLPEPVAALIRAKAEGHPFFSEELAYALRDAGLILIADGECRLAPDASDLDALSFPDTIQGVITGRIDRLSPPQQLALKVASVVGRVFAFNVLRDIHPIAADKVRLTDYLNALERLDITPLETPEPELSYIFKHIITREVAYNLMLFAQRRELHRAVAEWYERVYANDLTSFYPLLAHHWGQAGVTEKTLDYTEKAAEQALHSFANQEAVDFFSQALALDARMEPGSGRLRRGRWERQLGQAYWGLGRLEESRKHFQRAVALLGWPMPATRGRLVASLLGQALRQFWHRLRPARSAASPEARSTLLETARAYEHLAEISYHANERALIIYTTLRTLNLAERAGPSPELARAYANMCIIAGLIPLRSLAEAYGRRAQETAHSMELLAAQEHVLRRTGIYYVGVGQWDKAQGSFERAVAMAEHLGNQRAREEGLAILAWAVYYRSQFVRSKELFAQAYDAAHRSNNTLYMARGLSGQATNALQLGQLEEAVTLAQASLDLFSGDIDPLEEIRVYGIFAVVSLYQGDLQSAFQSAKKASSVIAESAPTSAFLLGGYIDVAQVYLALWEADASPALAERQELTDAARQACATLRRFARRFPIGQPRAWSHQGWADWLAGRPQRAHKAWQKSLSAAERLSMPYEQGLAHYEIGRHLDAQDPARRTHLTRACEILSQLGAAYELARAQVALRTP